MKTITLGKLNTYEQGHCDRDDNDDLIIKKYLLEDTYSSFIPYYTSDSMEELNELIDDRYVWHIDEDSIFFDDENNCMSMKDYLSQSLRTKLDGLGYFHLYKWDSKSRTYVEDLNLGTRTYPKEEV